MNGPVPPTSFIVYISVWPESMELPLGEIVSVGFEFTIICKVVAVTTLLVTLSVTLTVNLQLDVVEVGVYMNEFKVLDVNPGQDVPLVIPHE